MLPGKDITTTSLLLLSPPLKPHHLLPKMFHTRQNKPTSPHLPINQDASSLHKPKPQDTFLRKLISRKTHSANILNAKLVLKVGEKAFSSFDSVALTMVLGEEDETDVLDLLVDYALYFKCDKEIEKYLLVRQMGCARGVKPTLEMDCFHSLNEGYRSALIQILMFKR